MRVSDTHRYAFWDTNRVIAITVLALLPSLGVTIWENGSAIIAPLTFLAGLSVFWYSVFARLRQMPMCWDGISWAILFVLFLPDAVPLWQQGLALSFGVIMGALIFGGHGRGFLNPVTVGIAFLLFSFPGSALQTPTVSTTIAAVYGGALLLATGLLSLRIVVGFAGSFALLGTLFSVPDLWESARNASLLLGVVFLIGDPIAAASTNPGRSIYGLLAGSLVIFLTLSTDASGIPAATVFAALLSSIFAPLIDQIVIWTNVRRRAGRQING